MKKFYYFYDYSICKLGIAEEDGSVCRVFFNTGEKIDDFERRETPLLKEASKQLEKYFNKKLKLFDLPLMLHGTDFQVKVWKELQKIPYGKTRSYGEIASVTGNSRASRAVGMANNRNPIAIIVPCHRVIGHNGSLTGYAGGLELKRKLLELEGFYSNL